MPGGNGVMTFANKNRYEGGWQNGTFEGEGTFTWADGRVYVGKVWLMQGITVLG